MAAWMPLFFEEPLQHACPQWIGSDCEFIDRKPSRPLGRGGGVRLGQLKTTAENAESFWGVPPIIH
ncbi:MAG: hypothetical protein JWM16_2361 [Verrucomicrobiales bacterium]|nr:hypothetical protein [Verrucomicrobiales bacterium]